MGWFRGPEPARWFPVVPAYGNHLTCGFGRDGPVPVPVYHPKSPVGGTWGWSGLCGTAASSEGSAL